MAYVVRRLLLYIPVAFIVFTIVFWFIRLIPGDYADFLLLESPSARDQAVQLAIREDLGIDEPAAKQYFVTLGRYVQGDLGRSMGDGKPVLNEILRRAPTTLEVSGFAILFALLIAVPAGVISAIWQGTIIDYVTRVFAILALAVPNFWLATLIVVYPANLWQYGAPFPYEGLFDDPWTNLQQVLPAAAVAGSISAGILARFIRSALLEVLRQDYIRTARAKGLTERIITYRHILRNSIIPVVTTLGFALAGLASGSFIVEFWFGIPGVGLLALEALFNLDYPIIMALTILGTTLFVLANLIVDLAYPFLDPRIRLGGGYLV